MGGSRWPKGFAHVIASCDVVFQGASCAPSHSPSHPESPHVPDLHCALVFPARSALQRARRHSFRRATSRVATATALVERARSCAAPQDEVKKFYDVDDTIGSCV